MSTDARTLTLPWPPGVNHLHAVVRGRKILSREGRAYKERVASIALRAGWKPMNGECEVVIDLYRPQRRGDVDGRVKVILDSLQGFAYADDAQVGSLSVERYEDKENPRVVIQVKPRVLSDAKEGE